MSYRNFKVAVYCRADELNKVVSRKVLEEEFSFIQNHLHVDKVYLESYRGGEMIRSKEYLEELKEFFQSRGVATSGGITASPEGEWGGVGFQSFCYTRPEHLKKLKEIVALTAGIFDEIIMDDFYFTNCRCESCVQTKGARSWAAFRTELMKNVSEEILLKTAREINPKINMIIKFPNWYEHFQEAGYNLADEPKQFDMIYTGTETRNSAYTQQHLPRYLSYFNMRYHENIKPGKNGGGWFDPYECGYNLNSYVEQLALTLFSKPKEVTLFCFGALVSEEFSIFAPVAGHVFNQLDKVLGQLGNPSATATYIPCHSSGEDFLHNYLGMAGVPLEPFPEFPADAGSILLTENASKDKDIINKLRNHLLKGGRAVVTSGFVRALQDHGFESLANIRCSGRKAVVKRYQISESGIFFTQAAEAGKAVTIPQMEYFTNDAWQLAAGVGEENNFPVLLQVLYGKGKLYVLTIPEDYGDLYNYPPEVLKLVRGAASEDSAVSLDAAGRVALFTYDNDTFIVESFLQYMDKIRIRVPKTDTKLVDIVTGKELSGSTEKGGTIFEMLMHPSSYKIFKIRE